MMMMMMMMMMTCTVSVNSHADDLHVILMRKPSTVAFAVLKESYTSRCVQFIPTATDDDDDDDDDRHHNRPNE